MLHVLTGPDADAAIATLGIVADQATSRLSSPPDLDDDRPLVDQMIDAAVANGAAEPTELAAFLVDALEAEVLLPRVPRPMSRGERQICGLLIALGRPFDQLLLADPTAGLDGRRRRTVIDLLEELAEDGTEIVCSTDDPDLIGRGSTFS